jgi:hypothetical protein
MMHLRWSSGRQFQATAASVRKPGLFFAERRNGQPPEIHHSRHTCTCAHPDASLDGVLRLAAALVVRRHRLSGGMCSRKEHEKAVFDVPGASRVSVYYVRPGALSVAPWKVPTP